MDIRFLFNPQQVGSCIEVRTQKRVLIIDPGGYMSARGAARYVPLKHLDRVDAIILTHAHADHTLSLPLVTRDFPDAYIYASPATIPLTKSNLQDAVSIARYTRAWPGWSKEDRLHAISQMRPVETNTWVDLGGGVRFKFFDAGHILGARSILLKADGQTAFFSGDFCAEAQATVGAASWPQGLRPDVLVLESTYGHKDLPPKSAERDRLCKEVVKVCQRGGVALIGAFKIDRAQNILVTLVDYFSKHGLRYPIYFDGGARHVLPIYRKFLGSWFEQRILRFPHLRIVNQYERQAICASSKPIPLVVIAPAGMWQGGAILSWDSAFAKYPESAVFSSGFQASGTHGERVMKANGKGTFTMPNELGKPRPIVYNCDAIPVYLSGHPGQKHLLEAIEWLEPKRVILNHGEPRGQDALIAKARIVCPRYSVEKADHMVLYHV